MAKKEPVILERIPVTDVAGLGRSLARVKDMVIFVEGAVPGDVADLRILKQKNRYMEAVAVRIHEPGPHRRTPFCSHFGTCGGCSWQHLDYAAQLEYKRKEVIDNLERIAKIKLPEVRPTLGSVRTSQYRNKLHYTFTDARWLTQEDMSRQDQLERRGAGFHIPGRFDKVLDLDVCHLQPEPTNRIRNAVKQYAITQNYSFYNLHDHKGLLRSMIVRTAITTGDLMVMLQFGEDDPAAIEDIMSFVRDHFPEITSLMYIINFKLNDTFHDQEVICYHGQDHITERMENLHFRIGPKSFYQTNSLQAYQLYDTTRRFAGLNGHETVYDLYTGTGTIALFVAGSAGKVVGLEYEPMAIEDAKRNAAANGLDNCSFFAGDIKKLLDDAFVQQHGKPDVIITDPPRSGMHEDVVRMLIKAAPARIVYVSCNPATQARDLNWMDDYYEVKDVQPVDMFPHTFHVENVVLLERRAGV